MARLFALSVSACLLIGLGACSGGDDGGGGGGDGASDGGSGTGGNGGNAGGGGGEAGDSGNAGDGGANAGEGGSTPTCKTACDADDCGELTSDNCGGTLNCKHDCPTGQVCGLKRPDKCDAPDPEMCTPKAAAEVCPGKCGTVPDGCSGIITCTSQNGGVSCSGAQVCNGFDGNWQENKCVDIPVIDCTPKTCESLGYQCGTASDGCGNVLDCTQEAGGCSGEQICYFGEESAGKKPNTCVTPTPVCTPTQTANQLCTGKCGTVVDNCGTPVTCNSTNGGATCGTGTSCGGGGTPNECGSGAQACTPITSDAACANKCGFVSNGCSGGYICDGTSGGVSCNPNAGETCGGGGEANKCGKPACTPKDQSQVCAVDSCAKGLSDGCGGTIDCPACTGGKQCGIYTSDKCDMPVIPTCTKTPVATACANKCGDVADGCGGVYQCSSSNGGLTCGNGEWCSGGGEANKCGKPACTANGCGGNTCGQISNGCGGVLSCWPSGQSSCAAGSSCITQNGLLQCVAGGPSCVGPLCTTVPTPTDCSASSPTKLTGTVRTPGYTSGGTTRNELPVPNAMVYIPADTTASVLPSVFEGVNGSNPLSCGRCADEKLVVDGTSVLAAAVSDYKGEFTLEGRIPIGTAFNLVVKVGKWRRVVAIPATVVPAAQKCKTTALNIAYTKLAANSNNGLFPGTGTHLPKIAISTGKVDEMECVFRNIGISESEFTVPSSTGRIHMFRANGAYMSAATCTGTYGTNNTSCANNSNAGCKSDPPQSGCAFSNADSNLFNNYSTLDDYDLVVWDCEGGERFEAASPRQNVENYVNAGGRMFASHYSYTWIENKTGTNAYSGTLDQSATWQTGGSTDTATGFISMPSGNTARPGANAVKAVLLKNWLDWQGALAGTIAGSPLESPVTPQFTISDARDRAGAHVGPSTDEWVYRANYCSNDASRTCSANSGCMVCSNNSSQFCGQVSDCNASKTCSNNRSKTCTNNNQCPGASCDYANTCGGTATCLPAGLVQDLRVQQLSFNTPYGSAENQICGRVAYSGFHVANASSNNDDAFPAICGTGDLTAQEKILAFMLFDLATCVSAGDPPAPPACTPKTVAQLCPAENDACGYLSDGCGGLVDCAGCSGGNYCDANTCKPQQCVPSTCAALGYNCGQHSDSCGGVLDCGSCSGNQLCGLGGPGLCGGLTCSPIPQATACLNKNCGQVSNGCGGTYPCGTCPSGEVCGGSSFPNVCGAGSCMPIVQGTACSGKNCGSVSDGCGGAYECGTCTAPLSCGGGGRPNECGQPSCTPYTQVQACTNKGLQCGYVSDGCSGTINCGTCPNNTVCGGAGPNKCGAISCDPTDCVAEGAECGAIADKCGGILQCGTCPNSGICGAQAPNKCGTGQSCTPRNCAAVNAECGSIGDGCGGVLDCGVCTVQGETCGGKGVANQCEPGTGGCNKLICSAQNVECGPTSDGCGGVLDCGGCLSGYQCEKSKCAPILF